ncbi:hypothetical protein MNBD_GAMMA16-879, partial [hydrothermal vent metagenome]
MSYNYAVLALALFLCSIPHTVASQSTSALAAMPTSILSNSAALKVDTQITKGYPILLAQLAPLLPKVKSKIKREVIAEYAAETLAQQYLERLKNEDPGLLRVERKSKQLTRVFLGPFQDQLEAQPVLSRLKQLRILSKFNFDDELQGYIIRLGAFESNQRAQGFHFQLERLGIDDVQMTSVILNVFQVVRITISTEESAPPSVPLPSKTEPGAQPPPSVPLPSKTEPGAQPPPSVPLPSKTEPRAQPPPSVPLP